MEVKVSREPGDTYLVSLCAARNTSVYVLQHAYSVPAIPSFTLWFAHHPCSLLVFPLYNKIIFAVATGRSKHTSTSGFEKHCWSWLDIFLQWKQHFSVLTAEEPHIQILWDPSRLLEQNLIPQQQQLCFESPLAEELEGKLSVPNMPGGSSKAVVNFPIAVVSGKEQTSQDRQISTKEQEGEHLPQLAQKVPTWSIPRAVGPHRNVVEELVWGVVLERCCDSHRGTAAEQHFLPQHLLACKAVQLCGLWKWTAPCEPSSTCHPLGSCSGSLLSGSLSSARSIVAGSSMLLPCTCLFSLLKIFVQQQNLISKPLYVPAVCSQLELKTSAPRVGITAWAPAFRCAPENQL